MNDTRMNCDNGTGCSIG